MMLRRRWHGLALVVALVARSRDARADVTEDCIAANERSIELRKSGKLLEARAETAKCTVEACGPDIQRVCAQRIEDINVVLPSILFDVKDETGADIAGVKVTVDGHPADNATIAAMPLNPGEHTFVFAAGGLPPVERTIVLREGERQRRERIVLASGKPVAPPSTGTSPAPPSTADAGSSMGTQRIVGLTMGGAGVLGLALGTVFGLTASSKWSEAQAQCTVGGRAGCAADDPAQDTKASAESAATLSTVFFVTGGVLAVAGGILFFTAPKSSRPAGALRLGPAIGQSAAGLTLAGPF